MLDRSERAARLKAMLEQVTEGKGLESLPRPEPVGEGHTDALEGFFGADDTVEVSLAKLDEGRDDLTTADLITLEAIVMPQQRPVVLIKGGTYEPVEDPWTHLNETAMHERINPLLRSIGRVEVPAAPWLPFGGTGFIVGRDVIMTNRHVAKIFAEGVGLGPQLRYQAGDAAVDFKREADTPANDRSAYLTVQEVLMIHPYWDMALLRVSGLDGYSPLRLSVKPPDEIVGNEVVAIGFPARDDRNDLALQDRIFNRQYNVKRLQPGKLRPRATIRSFESVVNALTHDSSTLGGNSGSAIIDVQTGEVVGLHFAGEYLKANYAVPAYELARDRFVVARELNFGGSLAPANDWMPSWQRAGAVERTATPAVSPQPPAPTPALQSPPAVSPPASTPRPVAAASPAVSLGNAGSRSVTFTVPLRITIEIGALAESVAAGVIRTAEIEAARAQVPVMFGNLENRKGYQPSFLGLDDGEVIPLPTLTDLGASVAAKLEGGGHELKYHKFSVVIHKVRRLALFTAANVDWRPASKTIDGRKPTRKELTGLPDGAAEQWATDPRIPADHQLPDVFFTKDGGVFDKGHLVRREDVCWGKTLKDIQKANGDTYHTTNCSPQGAGFNRSTLGVENWGDLEDLVGAQTKAEKAILFSGPVLAEDDPLFEGHAETGRIHLRIPRQFWKIVVVKGKKGPEAYGFVLEQDLSAMPTVEEFAVTKEWRRHVRPVEAIEELLQGLADLSALRPFDHSQSEEGVEIAARLKG